jgi:S-adenosylmethionine hydrolase
MRSRRDGMPIITLTTDFGTDSPCVAAMKGVILSINPAATVVDVTHSVPAQDIGAGAVALADAYRWFPRGTIHVAVIDPGVGTARKIACLVGNDHLFVGPDNGVLSVAAGGASATRAFEISQPRYRLADVSNTFHGRDIMAPAAAHLSLGIEPEKLGPPLDDWVRLNLPDPTLETGAVAGEVLLIDSFGNLITNVTAVALTRVFGDIDDLRENAVVKCKLHQIRGLVGTYGEADAGEAVALIGSSQRLELAIVDGNAASVFGVGVGQRVSVSRCPASDAP